MRQNMVDENKKLDNSCEEISKPINQKPKIINGNMYALSQHQWRQQYLNYKRDLKKFPDGEKKVNYTMCDNNDELIDIIGSTEFKVKWGRLDNYLRWKKIEEYVNKIVDDGKLIKSLSKSLLELKVLFEAGKLKRPNASMI